MIYIIKLASNQPAHMIAKRQLQIQHCASAAIFQADDHTKPFSWVMQYRYGQIGHGVTHEGCRMK